MLGFTDDLHWGKLSPRDSPYRSAAFFPLIVRNKRPLTISEMTSLDPKVASLVDKAAREDDSDEDALIASLEDDDELDAFREQRLQQLHQEYDRARRLKESDHGRYTEIKDEKVLMDITTSTKLCVVHFFKPDFNRCRIMDTHLEVIKPSAAVRKGC